MLKDFISVTIGLFGILLLAYGAYLVRPAAGFIVLGLAFTSLSFLLSRVNAVTRHNKHKGK